MRKAQELGTTLKGYAEKFGLDVQQLYQMRKPLVRKGALGPARRCRSRAELKKRAHWYRCALCPLGRRRAARRWPADAQAHLRYVRLILLPVSGLLPDDYSAMRERSRLNAPATIAGWDEYASRRQNTERCEHEEHSQHDHRSEIPEYLRNAGRHRDGDFEGRGEFECCSA
jgi:hypothetical protein